MILSVGHGDTKFSFDSKDEEEVATAKIAVQDMIKRGYFIFVETPDGELRRVEAFDPATCEYVVRIDKRSKVWREAQSQEPAVEAAGEPNRRRGGYRVSARRARATAVAPTSGG